MFRYDSTVTGLEILPVYNTGSKVGLHTKVTVAMVISVLQLGDLEKSRPVVGRVAVHITFLGLDCV